MTFDEFAEAARQREIRLHGSAYPFEPWYYVLGLAGDAGEVADKVKRLYRNLGSTISSAAAFPHALRAERGSPRWTGLHPQW